MSLAQVSEELSHWILQQAAGGRQPGEVIAAMLQQGWQEPDAIEAVGQTLRGYQAGQVGGDGLPIQVPVPAPMGHHGATALHVLDREVHVLARMRHPRVVVFGGVLSGEECDALVGLARTRLQRSPVFNPDSGAEEDHVARTSEGMFFTRGANGLCSTIETRIAALLDWPLEHGEGLQVLRYGVGAEYKPHHDYFDPGRPGAEVALRRGGQRVASLIMYLNTPPCGGATVFPGVNFEVAPVKGNAVFFSYDRPHVITGSLHGGAPVIEGEKWVATKWLREKRHD